MAALVAHCRASLAAYKTPIDCRFVESLVRTASGKIKWAWKDSASAHESRLDE